MDELEKSNLVIAKILDLAMLRGVQQWMLSYENLELDEDLAPFFYPCVEWLEAEGIIRVKEYNRTFGGVANGSVNSPVLTAYGLRIMGQKLCLGEESLSVAEVVHQVSTESRSYSQFGDFVGGILGGLTKSLGQ